MKKLSLDGTWKLHEENGATRLEAAVVPGCVHTDLLEAGLIQDPWYRDNEKTIDWVWRKDWRYEREFELDEDFLASPCVCLRCDGLDTLAEVFINGVSAGRANNMFHEWEFDVRALLRVGRNTCAIVFSSPEAYMQERTAEQALVAGNLYHIDYHGRPYLRKMACAFGWDWGLQAPTCGIWRPISLLAYAGRISDVQMLQIHSDGDVALELSGQIEGAGAQAIISVTSPDGEVLTKEAPVENGKFALKLNVRNAQLWWPNELGEQPLYEVVVRLQDTSGRMLDEMSQRIGLRTIELVREPDEYGESFRFRVNGIDFFAKGANWIPCDVFPSRVSDTTYKELLDSAAEAHFNMLRVWGGGIYEDERFYTLCDELGILVWQDFMFACSTYPVFDDAFMDTMQIEAERVIQRLRHHPCMALWCGNNELEQGLVDWNSEE